MKTDVFFTALKYGKHITKTFIETSLYTVDFKINLETKRDTKTISILYALSILQN